MKPLILLLTLSALIAPATSAQRQYEPNFAIGVKGGMTLGRMSFNPHVQQAFTSGATAGIIARYTEERYFGLIGELLVTQRGWREGFDKDTPAAELTYNRHLTYIQLPLLTQIRFGSPRFKGFVNLGPSFGYMLGSSIDADFDYANASSLSQWPASHPTEQLTLEVSRKFDYGICAGLGGELALNPRNSILIEARYYYGIANVFPSARRDYFSASRTSAIEVTLAYLFRIK